MRRLVWVPVAVTLPLLLSACGGIIDSGGPASGGDLTGVTWVLDRASMMTLVDSVPKDARVDITFDGSQASGLAACNQYSGGYRADSGKGTLTFEQMASTQMACVDDGLTALEAAYMAALGDVTGYQVTGDQAGLQLTGGTAALTFQPEQVAEALPLEGTKWTLTTVAQPGTQAVSSTIAGTKVTLSMSGGTASGSGGCNTYSGPYETSGDAGLTFGALASTAMACADDVSSQEQAYYTALGKVASYTIEADHLTLSDGSGQMLLSFSGHAA
jgi:heat shock protein HslJ